MGTEDLPPTRRDSAVKALITLAPKFGGTLMGLYDDHVARRDARLVEVVQPIVAEVGDDVLLARLAESPALDVLFADAVTEAVRTRIEDKKRLLGNIVIRAVLDDATIDDGALLVEVLTGLEGPHIRALEALARAEDVQRQHLTDQPVEDEQRLGKAIAPVLSSTPGPVLALLVGKGLLSQQSGYGLYIAGTTDYGRHVLEQLRACADAPPADPPGTAS